MPLLQPKLSLKVTQRQMLTPGLMQMVSVLALNKLELKEMINAEIVANPVLEEVDESVPLLDEVADREGQLERTAEETAALAETPQGERDPFEEIDFGSYFQEYLDPGFRAPDSAEWNERPSFEQFLSRPSTLTDHLMWQVGALPLSPEVRAVVEYVIGNLDEDGYLAASDADLLDGLHEGAKDAAEGAEKLLSEAVLLVQRLDPCGIGARDLRECLLMQIEAQRRAHRLVIAASAQPEREANAAASQEANSAASEERPAEIPCENGPSSKEMNAAYKDNLLALAARIVDEALSLLLKRDVTGLAKALGSDPDRVQQAVEVIRGLDPHPGRRFGQADTRLIEPDVAFVKRGDEYVVVMIDDDMPALRVNSGYRRLLAQDGTEREVKEYVKDRYRSALQLLRNIEQRRSTILRTCEAILRRQPEFMEHGVDALRPMMIKEVAEEIGVHPSTVSRAVSNKYVHTPQGVFELRFFFSESANGPEGASTPLMLLKRKVKKFIEDEDPKKPLTDDLIASMLQEQGIQVTRRTVAKYREDLRIPSTHQRRIRS